VTVIERDQLPADARTRRGIPQGRHLHGLLPRGCQALETLFPGLVDELLSAGAPQAQFLRNVRFVLFGHELAAGRRSRQHSGKPPAAEGAVRAGVAALANVRIVDGCDVAGLVTDDGRVTGADPASSRRRGGGEAELVVDGMGRGGRTGAWLSELGFELPAEETMAPPDVYAAIRDAEPLTELVTHRTPASIRPATNGCAGSPPGCWWSGTPSAASTRSMARA
jgi:hypothetical protein